MSDDHELHVVFGAGPAGRAVMDELLSRGNRVRMVNRSGRIPDPPPEVEIVAGDAADPANTRVLCQDAAVVYNCTNPPYTEWPQKFPPLQAGVLESAAAVGARLVVLENLYMYGPTNGAAITEDLPYAAAGRKGRTRAQMARDLRAAHESGRVRAVAGRPSDFFGPRVLNSAMGERVFERLLAGQPAQILGNPDMLHTYTYIKDVGRALVTLGENDAAFGQAWHLPSARTLTTRAFIELIGEELGQPVRVQAVSSLVVRGMGLFSRTMREVAEMLYEFEEPYVVSHNKFARVFGNHTTPLRDAIRATLDWYRQRRANAATIA